MHGLVARSTCRSKKCWKLAVSDHVRKLGYWKSARCSDGMATTHSRCNLLETKCTQRRRVQDQIPRAGKFFGKCRSFPNNCHFQCFILTSVSTEGSFGKVFKWLAGIWPSKMCVVLAIWPLFVFGIYKGWVGNTVWNIEMILTFDLWKNSLSVNVIEKFCKKIVEQLREEKNWVAEATMS